MDARLPTMSAAGEELLERARGLRPLVLACSLEIEEGRRLPARLVEAMKDAGIFAMPIPGNWSRGMSRNSLTASDSRSLRAASTSPVAARYHAQDACQKGTFGEAAATLTRPGGAGGLSPWARRRRGFVSGSETKLAVAPRRGRKPDLALFRRYGGCG